MQGKTQTLNVSHLSEYKARQDNSIKTRLPAFTQTRLSKPLKTMLDEADDTLFDYSSKADTNLTQQAYLDAMREVRINRESIERGFLNAINNAFDVFRKDKNLSAILQTDNISNGDMLELIDEESVEESIAIQNMADKQERRFQRDIFELKSRIKAIYQCHDDAVEIHPLSPVTLVNAFAIALKPLDIEFHVKLIIFKLFDKFVMNEIGDVYKEINNLLINENILPNLAYHFKRSKSRSRPSTAYQNNISHEQASMGEHNWETVDNVNESPLFPTSQQHQSTESLLPTDFGLHGFIPMPSQSSGVIGTLSDMQDFVSHEGYPTGVSPKQMGRQIIDGIHRMGFSSVKGKRELDDNIINMVSMIFDYIMDDQSITDQIKSLFARLQIPFLKLALLDESFLQNRKHPARQLLNTMALAAIGWDPHQAKDNLYTELETIVEKVLGNFDQDIRIFSELLADFNEYWSSEKQLNRTYEERTWKTTEGKERVEYAKKRVDTWIHMWCSRDNIRKQVTTFLKHFWKNTMLYCMHQYGEDSKEWRYYIKVINTLIWSTTSGKNSDEVKQLIKITPLLIRGLNRGLLAVGTHPKTISDIFNEFSKCHMEIIEKGLEKPHSPDTDETSNGTDKVSLNREDVIHAIESIYDKSTLEDNDKPELEIDESLEALVNDVSTEAMTPEQETVEEITMEDSHYQQASQLDYGDWLEFHVDNKLVQGKLAWKSRISKNHLFVGRNGMRIAEKSLTEIADELRDGMARFIDKAPVVERALSAINECQQ